MANGFNQSKLDELNRKSGKLGKAPSFVLPAPQATGGEVPRPQAAAGGAPRPMLKRPEGGRITPVGFSDRQEAFRQKQDIIQGKTLEKRKIALSEAQGRADAPRIAADRAAKAAAAAANKLALVERPAEIKAASEERISANELQVDRESNKIEIDKNIADDATKRYVAETQAEATKAAAEIRTKKDPTPQESAFLTLTEETEGIRSDLIKTGSDLQSDLQEAMSTGNQASIIAAQRAIKLNELAIEGNQARQDRALRGLGIKAVVDPNADAVPTRAEAGDSLGVDTEAQPVQGDINNDGRLSAEEAPAGEEGALYDIKSEGGDIGELVKFAADNGLDIQRRDDTNLTGTQFEARTRAMMALRDATFRNRASGEVSEQHERLTEEVSRLTGIAAEVWGQNFFDEGVDKTPPVSTVHDANNDGSVNEADVQKIVKMTTFLDSIKKLRERSPNDPQLKEREEDIKEAEEVVKQLDAHRRKRAKELVARATGEQA